MDPGCSLGLSFLRSIAFLRSPAHGRKSAMPSLAKILKAESGFVHVVLLSLDAPVEAGASIQGDRMRRQPPAQSPTSWKGHGATKASKI